MSCQNRLRIQKTLFVCVPLLFVLAGPVFAQNRLQTGLQFYGEGHFDEAIAEFQVIGPGSADYNEALYWTALAEMSRGNYRESLVLFETLERAGANRRTGEISYHKGRLYYYLGRYEEAIVILAEYSETQADKPRRAAALYWVGESLYALGQYDKAESVFANLAGNYPESVKHDAALYRLDLIKQKKIEAELLSILKRKDEESLKTREEYRRRETGYDQTIADYHKRLLELENVPSSTTAAAESAAVSAGQENAVEEASSAPYSGQDAAMRLFSLKNDILELQNVISERLNRETW